MGKRKSKKKAQEEEDPPPALPEPVVIPSADFPAIVEPPPDTTLEALELTITDRYTFQRLKRPEARCCLPKFATAPDEALVYFEYLSQGGANVIFKIHSWPYASAEQGQPFLFVDAKMANMNATPIHHAELVNKVLRINKGLLKTLRCEEVIAGFYGHVRPLFMPGAPISIVGAHHTITSVDGPQFDFTGYLMDHRGVILYSSVMADLTSKCDAIGVERGPGSAQRLLTSRRWCILLPDMSPKPGSQVTIELKPKWLVQSPNAPEGAIRCRTCALQVLKPKDPTKYLCPLKLLDNADFDAVLKWVFTRVVEQAAGHTQDPALNNAIAWQLTDYLLQGPGKAILEHLRVLQSHLDYHGILGRNWIGNRKKELHGLFEHNLRLAMTLRDCSLYIRVGYSKDGVDSNSIDCKLGDLDFKSADKMEDWAAKETLLLEFGAYKQEVEDGPDCFLARSSVNLPDPEETIDWAALASSNYADFLALRRTCRAGRRASEAHLFKRLAIKGNGDDALSVCLLARLCDETDALATYVTTIELCPTDGEAQATNLRAVWRRLVNLDRIVWKTYDPIPAAIHAHLHAHPHIELHVTCSTRRPLHTRLEEAALSSPSLHTLCYTLFYHFSTRDTPSELHAFKTCVAQARRLKALTIDIRGTEGAAHYAPGPLNLQFEVGDTFPALEELTFTGGCYDDYVLSAAHCAAWVRAMDWGRLRALDLGHATPQYLLTALTGKIPRLKTLRMGFWPNRHAPRASWSSGGNLGVVTRFIEGIEALENVTLYTFDDSECAQIRPALLRKHGRGMKKLIIWLGMREAWKPAHFADLRAYVPGLQELDVPAEMYQKRKERLICNLLEGLRKDDGRPRWARSCWPTKIQRTLCSFKELRQLTLRVQLKYDSYQFVPDARPGAQCAINDEFAKKTALALFEGFGNNAAMELLKLVFRSKEPGMVVWTYTVQRRWMANEMKYDVVVDRTVEGEEAEERMRRAPFDPLHEHDEGVEI